MDYGRIAGILLHPTSLPGPYGIGELGREAYRFADFLKSAEQSVWQMLPLGPTGGSHSPYQSFSSFAGNPLLISVEGLLEEGLLEESDLGERPAFSEDAVDFEKLIPWKLPLLRRAYRRFTSDGGAAQRGDFERFVQENASWLDDYALFMAIKDAHGGRCWTEWPEELLRRDREALGYWRDEHGDEVNAYRFQQYLFAKQWGALRAYCNQRGIRLMGDLPIYTAHDSADCWAHPEYFHLDERGIPTREAGVPPDYFSATGQLWGNPTYRWDRLAETGYEWWIDRMRAVLSNQDLVRIDHFRGFESYWEVPAGEENAIRGYWVPGPGTALFDAMRRALGDLPIVAENLGIITEEVEALRKQLGFPGMGVLQFAFGIDPRNPGFLPHTYGQDTVAYTGTHDNDTVVGWWNDTGGGTTPTEQARIEREFAGRYLAADHIEIHWAFIRGVLVSPAGIAMVPLQDLLGLGSEARMNVPGTSQGNWRWRFRNDMLDPEAHDRLRRMTILYGRAPNKASVEALF